MAFTTFTTLIERGEIIVATGIASQDVWAGWRRELAQYKIEQNISSRVLVTFNGAYTQGYREEKQGWTLRWLSTNDKDMYSTSSAKMKDLCADFLKEILGGRSIDT